MNFLYSSKDFIRNENTVVEELHEILNISVSERLTADVPVEFYFREVLIVH